MDSKEQITDYIFPFPYFWKNEKKDGVDSFFRSYLRKKWLLLSPPQRTQIFMLSAVPYNTLRN